MLIAWIQKTTLLDYPGKVATLIFTPGCNFRCGYCHNPEFVLPEQLRKSERDMIGEEVFFRFLKTRIGLIDGVVICWGEPTIHIDLPVFCRRIKEFGLLVKLDTNGSNPEMIRNLLDEWLVDYIAMDIKYPIDRYGELTGKTTNRLAYMQSIELIMDGRSDYEFRTTVVREYHTNEVMERIGETIRWARRYFIQNYRGDKTLDPCFVGTSLLSGELEALRSIMLQYVSHCAVRT